MKKLRTIIALALVLSFLGALYVPMEASAATSTKFSAMLARAEALCNYEWVPTSRIYTWNGNRYNGKTYFEKGETVKGVPYTLFFYEMGVDSLLSLEQYKAVASKNYSTTTYASSAGANRTGPVYGNCCATFVSEVFGGSFMNGSNPRYDSVYKIRYNSTDYSTTTTNVKLKDVKAGDALSNTSGGHIIWIGAKTATTITIYESTPPVCKKTVLNIASNTDSNGYLYYAGGTYSIRTRSKEIIYDDGSGTTEPTVPAVNKVYTDYTPITAFPCVSADFDVQESDFTTKMGTIYTTDECTINEIYDNGWCQVTYPTTTSTKTGYTLLSNFVQNKSYTPVKYSLSTALTTYETKSLETSFGSSKNFYVVGESGTASQVFYKLSAGGYKLAWISTASIPNEHVCEAQGNWLSNAKQHYKLCSCGETVNAANHDSGTWVTTKEAQIGVAGSKELRCTVCAYVLKTASIPALADPNAGNLAYQKTYTADGIYVDGEGAIPYPDEDGKTLTDGNSGATDATYYDAALAGFNRLSDFYKTNGYAAITVDLGACYKLSELVAQFAPESEYNIDAGVHLPTSMSIYVSDDKVNWTSAGSAAPSGSTATVTPTNAAGRYVQYRFVSETNWIMVSEVKAYGTAHTHAAQGNWLSNAKQHYKLCSCGKTVNAANHDSGTWVTTKEAQIGVAGSKELRCTVCAYVLKTASIPALADPNAGNLAYQKPYTADGIHVDGEGAIPYPDEDGKTLTDGKLGATDATYYDAALAGFNRLSDFYKTNGYAAITVDLGACYKLSELVAQFAPESEYNVAAGVHLPTSMSIYVSDDKVNWTSAGSAAPSGSTATVTPTNAAGRYVQYRFVSETNWIMVSEVKAYGTAHTHAAQGNWLSNAKQHYKLCSCGKTVNAANHDSGTWVTTKEAQIGVAGSKELRCTVCAYVLQTASIPALADPNAGNLAYQKPYTADGIYVDGEGAIPYPDEDGKTLTDGKLGATDATYYDAALAGFNRLSDFYKTNGYAAITVDLGACYKLSELVAQFAPESEYNVAAGIHLPTSMSIYVSDDKVNWTSAGSAAPSGVTATVTPTNAAGRYVQYRFVSETNWIMVSEVKAYGTAHTHAAQGNWLSNAKQHYKLCSCGKTVNAANHDSGTWVTTKEAQIGVAGSKELRCTVCQYVIKTETIDPLVDDSYLVGDLDQNGEINSSDYLLLKRVCFETFFLDEKLKKVADVNCDNIVDITDYLLLKRACFGSYVIQQI